jgi:hypothetical protein
MTPILPILAHAVMVACLFAVPGWADEAKAGDLAITQAWSQSGDDSFFMHLHTGKAMANVTVLPARVGPVDITIQLETTDETPLTAKALFVTLTNAKSGIAPQTAEAERTSDDQWLVKMSAPLAGRWMLGLGITLPNFDRVDVESPIIIK